MLPTYPGYEYRSEQREIEKRIKQLNRWKWLFPSNQHIIMILERKIKLYDDLAWNQNEEFKENNSTWMSFFPEYAKKTDELNLKRFKMAEEHRKKADEIRKEINSIRCW